MRTPLLVLALSVASTPGAVHADAIDVIEDGFDGLLELLGLADDNGSSHHAVVPPPGESSTDAGRPDGLEPFVEPWDLVPPLPVCEPPLPDDVTLPGCETGGGIELPLVETQFIQRAPPPSILEPASALLLLSGLGALAARRHLTRRR